MPCESCAVQFSVFKRKRSCSECERYYCSGCLRRGGGAMCAPCRVLSTRPLSRQGLGHLKVRDLQCFLHRQNVSTRHCVEKEDLISLVVSHVNSPAYRRRAPRSGAFSTLKGFTNNINEFITNTFDLRTAHPAPPPPNGAADCYNSTHAHTPPGAGAAPPGRPRPAHAPGPPPPAGAPSAAPAGGADSPDESGASAGSARRDTADCFEIEDLDDAGWEFVARPADPLPDDSDVLLAENDPPRPPTPHRAASELDLRRSDSDDTAGETSSLKDESFHDRDTSARRVELRRLEREADLELLNVKQLKELLATNRVDYRGCIERAELLERAKMLWNEDARFRDDAARERLPAAESCKICMAAPLECVLLECGHIAACTACAKQLAECPICRRYVVRAVRFFRS